MHTLYVTETPESIIWQVHAFGQLLHIFVVSFFIESFWLNAQELLFSTTNAITLLQDAIGHCIYFKITHFQLYCKIRII